MPENKLESEGEIAYHAFQNALSAEAHEETHWDVMPEQIQNAWQKAATEVLVRRPQIPMFSDPTSESRGFRQRLDVSLQLLKHSPRRSRERNLAITKIQEAIMWLGMDLKAQRDEGLHDEPNPYPNSYNPASGDAIAPTADGLEL